MKEILSKKINIVRYIMAKKKEVRCPLRNECGRKCEFEFRELQCDYYKNNGIGDNVIPDQEEHRRHFEALEENKLFSKMFDDIEPGDDGFLETVKAFDAAKCCGDLSEGSSVQMIELGRLCASQNNIFAVEDDITALAEDIKVNGLLSPLTVCPSENESFYRIISGHRRYKALCSIYENSFEVPCVVTWPKSPEAEEYMLIQANMSSRELGWQEKENARKRTEEVLLKLKAQGVEFPGKLRKHVAAVLKTSEAQLAKSKYISEHMIKELQEVSDSNINFDARYKIAHWPEDVQKSYFDEWVSKNRYVWNYDYYNIKIKNGENPFVEVAETSQKQEPEVKTCYISSNYLEPCDNVENLGLYKDSCRERFGINMKCLGGCCFHCNYRNICPGVCKVAKSDIESKRRNMEIEFHYIYRVRLALRSLLLDKGFNEAKIEDLANLDGIFLEEKYSDFYTYIYGEELSLRDLLWYLSKLEITPNEFFEIVEKHTDPPCEYEAGIKPTWKIYLGEEQKE